MVRRNVSKRPYVVGIGASAGGLEALEDFFKHFPPDSGLTFVVIQHLSPDFKSLMDELLARHTQMKIVRVDQEVTIEPNCIYLIPPKKNLSIKGTKLIPSHQDPNAHLRLPIDAFFVSLAEQYASNAIGVILSGTGSDGTRGCGSIKENEGFVIAQEPSGCKFDGMPVSVIKHGIPDMVANPEQMPDIILKYANINGLGDLIDLEREPNRLRVVTSLLKTIEGLDFGGYRPSTIARRIERRVRVNHLSSLDDYIHLLRNDVKELGQLHGELLIGVTRFFRDKSAFEVLSKSIIPRILEEAAEDDVIRIWVAGCSTGEEAYSLGISFFDALDEAQITKDVKIFATDVDREAIEIAAVGRYPESIVEDVGKERTAKYFLKKGSNYEVRSKLRRSVIFSHHNVVKDPPFTRMHLISCRNLLIYFQSNLQTRALSLFHFGLKNNGYLFLGKSEALGEVAGEFDCLNPTHKIFRKLRDIKLAMVSDINMSSQMLTPLPAPQTAKQDIYGTQPGVKEPRLSHIYENLLNDYVPPCLILDENYQLLHSFGDASLILDVPTGKSTLNVLRMLDQDLSIALSTAIARATKTERNVLFKDVRKSAHSEQQFNIKVKPLPVAYANQLRTFMVSFEEIEKENHHEHIEAEVYDAQAHTHEQIAILEEQLLSTKESLQATIEELETTNEELQSTNEELMSSNEELQSSNEELQSVNEELYTVNAEHQEKINELTEANNDIDFLLKSSNIGTIFLDKNLRIRRYNRDIESIVNVMHQDIGRPITDITFNFAHDKIVSQILDVAASGLANSQELVHKGTTYIVKSVPYRADRIAITSDDINAFDEKSGVVLSFIDVSTIKEAKDLKRLTQDAEEFNYVVAHDLRSPLRKITESTTKLKEAITIGVPEESHIEKIAVDIDGTVETLTTMLDSLLKYSRLRTRGGKFKKFSPKAAVLNVMKSMKAELKGVSVIINHLPDAIHGDPGQFKEVMVNLFKNSLDHQRLGQDLSISLSASEKSGFWEFSIQDNGSGFRGVDRKKAFEIFCKDSKQAPGTKNKLGVGLAFSKRIVDRHGGEIWVKPTMPEEIGSTVCFTLPEAAHPRI